MADPTAVAKWRSETLEFLTTRGPVMVDGWSPRVAKDLARTISGVDWELLVALNAFTASGTTQFLGNLPQLIRRELVGDWSRRDTVTFGRVKGVIDLPATAVARVRSGSPAAISYRKLQRVWDTDENRALAGFLVYAERTARQALQRVKTNAAWQERVVRNLQHIRAALMTPPLRDVQPDAAWAVFARRPLTRRRTTLYEHSRKLAAAWAEGRIAASGEALRGVLGGWLTPAADDAVFEAYVASIAVEALFESRAWDSFRLAPLGFGHRLVEARVGDLRATLSFDASLSRALARSVPGHYRWIFDTYDELDLAARRPDFTLHLSVPGSDECVVLLEAKATDANSQYGRDSIYKCLGYLKDFDRVWGSETPRVVLIFASGVASAIPLAKRLGDDLLLTSDASLLSDIGSVIKACLSRFGA